MPPWPNFPPWPCLDSQLPTNTELSLLCHNDESGRTLRLRTTSIFMSGKHPRLPSHSLDFSPSVSCRAQGLIAAWGLLHPKIANEARLKADLWLSMEAWPCRKANGNDSVRCYN